MTHYKYAPPSRLEFRFFEMESKTCALGKIKYIKSLSFLGWSRWGFVSHKPWWSRRWLQCCCINWMRRSGKNIVKCEKTEGSLIDRGSCLEEILIIVTFVEWKEDSCFIIFRHISRVIFSNNIIEEQIFFLFRIYWNFNDVVEKFERQLSLIIS